MISNLEFKKQVKAINSQTQKEIADLLYKRWLLIISSSGVDGSVIGLCCLYCEKIYSFILGQPITSVHDLFIDLRTGEKNGN